MSIVGEVVLSLMVMMMVMMKEKYKYFEIILQSDCLRYIVELCHSWRTTRKKDKFHLQRLLMYSMKLLSKGGSQKVEQWIHRIG